MTLLVIAYIEIFQLDHKHPTLFPSPSPTKNLNKYYCSWRTYLCYL